MEQSNQPTTQITFTIPSDLKIKENARKILSLRFEHPDWTNAQISEVVGVSKTRVSQILNHPRILAVMPLIARQHISGMVPDAVKAYRELVNQKENLQVREKAANKILTEKKVLDAPTVNVKGEITLKHVSELQDIVRKAVDAGLSDVVDAEIVDEPGSDTGLTTQ